MQNEKVAPQSPISESTAIDLMFTGFRKSFIHDNRRVIVGARTGMIAANVNDVYFICEVERMQTSPDLYAVFLYDEYGRVVAMCKMDEMDK